MENNNIWIALILALMLVNVICEYTAEDCRQLGFNKAQLLCSQCSSLSSFNLDVIRDNCNECCTRDGDPDTAKKYAKAVLEVCTCKFGAYPQIQAFIKSDRPNKFTNLKIHYVRGLDPIIKLMNEKGEVEDTLAIEKWDTDTVDEFLKTHLMDAEDLDYLKTNRI